MWLLLVIVWNYCVPNALPYEDVFVTVVLALCLNYCKSRCAPIICPTKSSLNSKGQSGNHY